MRDIYPLGDYNLRQIQEMAEIIQDPELDPEDRGDPNALYAVRPDAAPKPEEFIANLPAERAPYIIPDALSGKNGIAMTLKLTIPQLEQIGAYGDVFLKETVKMNLKVALERNPADSNAQDALEYINASPAWQL